MEKENKIPGPPVGYTDLLDYETSQKLKKDQEAYKSGEKKRYYPLRPSSAGFCSRRLAYELMEYHGHAEYGREIIKPNVHRLFALGNSVEYSVLRQFQLVNIVQTRYKQQVLTCFELNSGKIIEGSCDACFISDKYKCIMDVKSVKDGFSKAYPTRWDDTLAKFSEMKTLQKISDTAFYAEDVVAFIKELGEDFLVENIMQLNVYACADFMIKRGIDHAVIYKYNKNDSRHYELRFKPSQALADKVEKKFNLIDQAVANKDPNAVPKDYVLGAMHCAFCPFKKQCWGDDNTLRAWFKTFPPRKWPVDITKCNVDHLVSNFHEYEELLELIEEKKMCADIITKTLVEGKIQKIRLDNGHVYEVKYLKSPKSHFELRRSKA